MVAVPLTSQFCEVIINIPDTDVVVIDLDYVRLLNYEKPLL